MTRGDIRAGRAFVELVANSKPLQAGLAEAQRSLLRFASAAAVLGGASASLKKFASDGAAVQDVANRLGASAGQIAALAHAAKMSGTSIEALEPAMYRLQRAIVEASEGSATAEAKFSKLGLAAEKLRGLTLTQQLQAIAEALAGISDPAERNARAIDIFGKAAGQLVPLLQEGKDGIAALVEEANRLGLVMSDDLYSAAAALDDSVEKLNAQWNALVMNAGALVNELGLVEAAAWAAESALRAQRDAAAFTDKHDFQGKNQMAAARASVAAWEAEQRKTAGPGDAERKSAESARAAKLARLRELEAMPERQRTIVSEQERMRLAKDLNVQTGRKYTPPPPPEEAARGPLSWLERGAKAGGPNAAIMFSDEAAAAAGRLAELEAMKQRDGGTVGTFSATAAVALGGSGTMEEALAQARAAIKLLQEFNSRQKDIERAIRESAPEFTE